MRIVGKDEVYLASKFKSVFAPKNMYLFVIHKLLKILLWKVIQPYMRQTRIILQIIIQIRIPCVKILNLDITTLEITSDNP